MPRTEPRAYLRFVVDEWPLIEAVFDRCCQRPILPSELRQIAGEGATPNVVNRLLEEGIIVQLPHSSSYEMGDFIQNLIRHLKKEHTLGLADEIRVYLDDLKDQTAKIVEALQSSDYEKLYRHADNLENRIRIIRRHLNTNYQAMLEMVERAKTTQAHTSLRQRYGEVIEAWETYIEPVQEMARPHGPFESQFERLERELNYTIQHLESRGGLVSERRNFEVLLYRMMALRGELKTHLSQSRDELLPLVQQVRRNSTVARGASMALKCLRAHGKAALPIPRWVPIQRLSRQAGISAEEAIEQYLTGISDYSPKPEPLVWDSNIIASSPVHISIDEVLWELRNDLPVTDLLGWIIDNWGDTADTEDLLDIFFGCRQYSSDMDFIVNERQSYETRTHFVKSPRVQVSAASNTDES